MKNIIYNILITICIYSFTSCESLNENTKNEEAITPEKEIRIVSLNGTITEIICATGHEENIVGTDITSTYPEEINRVPKIGHVQNIQAEGIISLNPTIVFAKENELKPQLLKQIKAANIEIALFKQEYTVEGTRQLIKQITNKLFASKKGEILIENLDKKIAKIQPLSTKPKILFIYARGVGTLMVAGKNTQMESMIELVGGKNSATKFNDFKPLTPESLVASNPDIILLFSTGLESLDGEMGLKNIPGLSETNAGKNKAFIAMDGQYLAGFGPRLGEAALELNEKIRRLNAKK